MDLTLLSGHLDRLVFVASPPISALNYEFSGLFSILNSKTLVCIVKFVAVSSMLVWAFDCYFLLYDNNVSERRLHPSVHAFQNF